ncbi:4-alpha-glucanotransferase [Clostridium hydrogenum]|uniref:4-alpha-glucanotransferase n=1 Tax=Clostridium hydrogenum TaxID=2855764 RepID=UPI001F41103F|nr:4-alpha-glucanotransferase [Clostridium hydrogenum]
MINMNEVTIVVHYPTPENQEEYDRRVAEVYAEIISRHLSNDDIRKLARLLKSGK